MAIPELARFSGVGKVLKALKHWTQSRASLHFAALLSGGTSRLVGLKDVGTLLVFFQLYLMVRYNTGKFPFYDPNYSS